MEFTAKIAALDAGGTIPPPSMSAQEGILMTPGTDTAKTVPPPDAADQEPREVSGPDIVDLALPVFVRLCERMKNDLRLGVAITYPNPTVRITVTVESDAPESPLIISDEG